MKAVFYGFISRVDTDDKITSELEDMPIHSSQCEIQREKKRKNEKRGQNIHKLGQFQRCNICIIGITGEERGNGAEVIFEVIMAKIFPKLVADIKQQTHEAQKTPNNKYQNLYLGISRSNCRK